MSQPVEAGARVGLITQPPEHRDAWPLRRPDAVHASQDWLADCTSPSVGHCHGSAAGDDALLSGVTVVVPVYNSQHTLELLVAQLAEELPACGEHYEVILVNDGSRDQSWQIIRRLASRYSWVRGISMMRNFGQHNAILCGLRAATCDTIVTMDDDLQHPPAEIHKLLAKLREGHDVVYGMPQGLPHSSWRNFTSSFTKRVFSLATGDQNIKAINAFRAFRTGLRQAFTEFKSPQLQIDVLLSWGTSRFASTPVRQEPRKIGRSNYTFSKLFNHTLSLLTGYSTAPLRVASLVGFAFTFLGLLVLLYAVGRALIGEHVAGFPFLASLISIFSGIQLFILGIMGEYLARVFNRCSERPPYVMSETIDGCPARGKSDATSAAA